MVAALKYWPLVVGLCSSLVFGIQAAYSLGQARSDFSAAQDAAAADRARIKADLDEHHRRPAHETTAIRLERIEVQQMSIARDVERMAGHLDRIADDLQDVAKRKRTPHAHDH